MKRAAVGFAWFLVLWLGTLTLGGAIAGSFAKSEIDPKSATTQELFEKSYQAGQVAGYEFGQAWGGVILIAALVLSIGGTLTGKLPGTAKKAKLQT